MDAAAADRGVDLEACAGDRATAGSLRIAAGPECPGVVARQAARTPDRGSVTPLIIGMVIGLLLLGSGVTAATSAFLARTRLQGACDGAAAAAADAAQATRLTGGPGSNPGRSALSAAQSYLATHTPQASVAADTTAGSVRLTCTATAEVTFGALFGVPTVTLTVQALGHPVL